MFLRCGLLNYSPGLALNLSPPDFCFLRHWSPALFLILKTIILDRGKAGEPKIYIDIDIDIDIYLRYI
jgi:hypothetical protein